MHIVSFRRLSLKEGYNQVPLGLLQRGISGNIGQTLGEKLLYAVVGMSWFLTSKVLL